MNMQTKLIEHKKAKWNYENFRNKYSESRNKSTSKEHNSQVEESVKAKAK